MRKSILLIMAVAFLFTGCVFTRTVYIPSGKSVQLREGVKGVKIWAKDSKGVSVPGKIDIPEGWYALPMPSKE